MTRLGRVGAASDVYALTINPLTRALYAGFISVPPDAQMWTTSAAALPVDMGTFNYGQGSAIYANKVGKGPSGSRSPSSSLTCVLLLPLTGVGLINIHSPTFSQAFLLSEDCNILYAATDTTPSYINVYDMVSRLSCFFMV